jgi:hypothetical protein
MHSFTHKSFSSARRRPRLLVVFVLLALCGIATGVPRAQARGVHIDFFYESLSPYGEWVNHPRHGRVWYPRNVDYNWRPYTLGRWVNTEEHGWMWVSDEEWGWGPYHYGRWDMDDRYGWVWIPGDRWGPAWVEWRTGGGHIGWAPLPPEAVWRDDRIYYASTYDYEAPRFRPAWVFVEEVYFVRPRVLVHCLAPAQNITIINRTTNITNYAVVNQTIVNRSINVTRIQQVTNQPVPLVKVAQINTPAGLAANAAAGAQGSQVAVFKPVISNGGPVVLAAGITAAAVAAAAKVTHSATQPTATASPLATQSPVPPQVTNSGKQAEPPQTLKSLPEASKATAIEPKKVVEPKSAEPKARDAWVTEPKRVIARAKPQPSSTAAADRRRVVRQKQQLEQVALRQRQKEERSNAALIQKPKVVYNQLRERAEERRIQASQRRVEIARQTPPPRVIPQPTHRLSVQPGQSAR